MLTGGYTDHMMGRVDDGNDGAGFQSRPNLANFVAIPQNMRPSGTLDVTSAQTECTTAQHNACRMIYVDRATGDAYCRHSASDGLPECKVPAAICLQDPR